MNSPEHILNILKGKRLFLHDEKQLQAELYNILMAKLRPATVVKEYMLDHRNIIDFFILPGIGLEVKTKGTKREIYRQLERYSSFSEIHSLILITNLSMGLPEKINGKPCYIHKLGQAWL